MNLLSELLPRDIKTSVANHLILYSKAHAMARKLSHLTWADRDLGFQEWSELVDALNAIHTYSEPEQKE